VAGFLGVSAPAVTKNIDKLVQLGLLARKASNQDRRVSLLSVSRKGRHLVTRYEARKRARLREVLQAFLPEEIEQLTQLLERLAVRLYAAARVDGGYCLRCAAYIREQCPVGELRGGCPYQQLRRSGARVAAREGVP
jgi:hypothetical protein